MAIAFSIKIDSTRAIKKLKLAPREIRKATRKGMEEWGKKLDRNMMSAFLKAMPIGGGGFPLSDWEGTTRAMSRWEQFSDTRGAYVMPAYAVEMGATGVPHLEKLKKGSSIQRWSMAKRRIGSGKVYIR